MTRKQQREHIFRLLFQIEFIQKIEIDSHVDAYLEALVHSATSKGKEVDTHAMDYIKDKFYQILSLVDVLDEKISSHATGWKISRMNKVDLTILRLALFEMEHDESIPLGVAINEAVELAKKFSGEEGPSFVNGVLAKMI
ncbi:MAG: transcription antitermination factor NusB [Lachnospiraceae bacterium]|nr:transcription antitermination factor NusB [Lachnospiraceae bacterium]